MSFMILFSLMVLTSAAVEITSERTGHVFTDDETVRFQVETAVEAVMSVTDYGGRKIFERGLSAGKSTLELGTLPRNHYTMTIRSGDEVREIYFGVVPSLENHPIRKIKESCIASDVAMSWLVKPERFEELAQLTKLSGVVWVRDRINWGEVEPERGRLAEHTRYDLSAEIQTEHGLKVYQVFHATPGWTQEEANPRSFPDDLRDIYNFAAEAARRFKGEVLAWEIWNEPDIIQFSDELGDSYAALLKTAYLGFKSADPELPILLCSFAIPPGNFAETVFQNDVGNYFDIYNYHIYGTWENHADRALKHLELMRRYGLERKPIWLTEAGRPIKRIPTSTELTSEQELDVAEFLPKAIVSSLSAGVDKYFWFIMPYYRERDVMLFGLLREDMTPTPGYCALSACTYALGKAEYRGRLDLSDIHAHVFDRGNGELAITFWADEGEKDFNVLVNPQKVTLVSLMGAEQEMKVQNGPLELKASPSVKYLILPADALQNELKIDHPREKSEIKPYDPALVSPIVLRIRFPKETRDKKSETYQFPRDSLTKVEVEVYNFGEGEFSGKLKLLLPKGWKGTLNSNEVSVNPMGRVVQELELSPSTETSSDQTQLRVNLINLSGEVETFIIGNLEIR